MVTKLKDIVQIANNHFISKINKIRSKFHNNSKISPLQVLNFLIPPNKNQFHLPLPTIKEINKIIKGLKSSNAVGNDILTSKILKKMAPNICPHLTHLYVAIINIQIYPDILKVT